MSWLAEETAGVRAYLARLRQNFGTRFLLLLVSCVPRPHASWAALC